ncbi:MAG TPA: cobalamin-dependent protein [Longimicrobiaceae bacterium]|nr:cobalamin-dependent protein [Longimicrobiaceae bacterium]
MLQDLSREVAIAEEHSDWSNYPNLGILQLASAIRDIPGIEPVYLDGTVCPLRVIKEFISANAESILAVCVSVLTATYQAGVQILGFAKQADARITTIVGNDHFTALPSLCLGKQAHLIDYGFTGNEIIASFRALVGDLKRGAVRPPSSYPSLAAGPDGTVAPSVPEPVFTDIDYTLIDKDYHHSDRYRANFARRVALPQQQAFGRRLRQGVPVEIGRGCIKFLNDDACSFCAIQYGGMWRNAVPSGAVAWEVIERAFVAGYDYLYVTADELPNTFRALLVQMRENTPGWWKQLDEAERPLLAGYARADGLCRGDSARLLRELGFRVIMIGLDAANPTSLAALNKPIRSRNGSFDPEAMFRANCEALSRAKQHGLRVKVGVVLGHLGMTAGLLRENLDTFQAILAHGREAIASVDVEVLSPEPGSRDYLHLLSPELATATSERLGLTVADAATRGEIAEKWRDRDAVDLEEAMRDYVAAFMPDLSLEVLISARRQLRGYARDLGIFVGEQ